MKEEIKGVLSGLQNKPHCDIDTGKIYGCEEGSLEWWHEKGHIEFAKQQLTSVLIMWQGVAHLIWMFAITLAILNVWMLWIAFPMVAIYVGVDVYEEHWANQYANSNFNKNDKRKDTRRS